MVRRSTTRRRSGASASRRGLLSRLLTANMQLTRGGRPDRWNDRDGIDPPGRNLDYECGHPEYPTIDTYRRLYDREDYAKRVVDCWSDECWSSNPEVYETEEDRHTKFERAWQKLNKRINIWHYLHRIDRLCGIGCFGVLLLGLSDGKTLDQPVAGIDRRGEISKKRPKKQTKLLYLRPFSEESVIIDEIEEDRSNPRYGQPRYYQLKIMSPGSRDVRVDETVRVHWSRIIHVADNCESSDYAGTPRMQPVLNRLLDIRKTLGGSAEMFWKGAFPGYSFETVPELLGESVMNEDSIKEQFEEYMEGLKRYLALDGVTAKALLPQTADPTAHVMQQVTAICATLQIPLRQFLGTEAGHLASTQDSGSWNKRVARRQLLFVEPQIIRPLIDRLIMVGVLPDPGDGDYIVSWRDLNTMSDADRADVSLKRAQAMMQYVSGKVETIMAAREFFTLILGLTGDEADAVMKAVAKNKQTLTDPLGDRAAKRDAELQVKTAKAMPLPPKPQGGGRVGNAPKASPGRPAGKIQKNRRKVRRGQHHPAV